MQPMGMEGLVASSRGLSGGCLLSFSSHIDVN